LPCRRPSNTSLGLGIAARDTAALTAIVITSANAGLCRCVRGAVDYDVHVSDVAMLVAPPSTNALQQFLPLS